jgi:Fe-S-cluster containining protein
MNIAVRAPEIASAGTAGLPPVGSRVVAGRDCGTCTLCCKVAAVEEVFKPNGVWCSHCVKGKGCTIYDQRPASCRSFYCQWMLDKTFGPEWKPERAKFAMVKSEGGRRLTALVDPGFPSAWRRSPYYENLKQWAADAVRKLPDLYFVDVLIGAHAIVILPDRDVDLGILGPDEMIQFGYKMNGTERVAEVRKVPRVAAAA